MRNRTGEQRLTFAVPGPPVAWHRPEQTSRTRRIDGRGVRTFKNNKDREFQLAIGIAATAAMMRWAHDNDKAWNAEGEWKVILEFHVPDLKRRDIDNLEKNVLDGLSTVAIDDDTQVVDVHKVKRLDRSSPRTVVTLERVQGYLSE